LNGLEKQRPSLRKLLQRKPPKPPKLRKPRRRRKLYNPTLKRNILQKGVEVLDDIGAMKGEAQEVVDAVQKGEALVLEGAALVLEGAALVLEGAALVLEGAVQKGAALVLEGAAQKGAVQRAKVQRIEVQKVENQRVSAPEVTALAVQIKKVKKVIVPFVRRVIAPAEKVKNRFLQNKNKPSPSSLRPTLLRKP
jgi:hypothetical protein